MLKEKILDLFFKEHLKVKEISTIVHTSSSYVTEVIKQDARYDKEKAIRKNIAYEKRKSKKRTYCTL